MFRNRLKVWRAERGLSQMDAAIKAKIGKYRFWQIENGYIEPTPQERESLATALDCTESDLFPQQVSA